METDPDKHKIDRALGLDPDHPPTPVREISAREVAAERSSRRRRRLKRRLRRRFGAVLRRH